MERFARDISSGNYSPSFFTIRIPNEENYDNLLQGERLSDAAEAYFLHEYIHFLQDLTTVPGLSNIGIVVDYMKWATHQGKKGKLKVPCVPSCSDGYNLLNNALIGKARIGQGSLKDGDGNGVIVSRINSISQNEQSFRIENRCFNHLNSIVLLQDSTGREWQYILGEHAISESMAYLIERLIYPEALSKGSDTPYNIVEYICNKELPGFSDDKIRLIALCDACLIFSFPGNIFKLAIDILKQIDYTRLSPEDVFDLLIHDSILLNKEGINDSQSSIFDHLEQYSFLAAEQLKGYFTTGTYNKERDFSVLLLLDALELRKQLPHFFIDVARGGQIRDNNTLKTIMGELGCPVILNQTDSLFTIIGQISNLLSEGDGLDPSCFWVINQFYKILKKGCLTQGTFKCEMIDWCRSSFNIHHVADLTEDGDSCIYSPWLRTTKEECQQCAFGRFWATWGLSGIAPVTE